ncbi:MAG: preprotein translocase subunit SecA [Patescibacteria group bacterium]
MFNALKNLWDTNLRELKRLQPRVEAINALEPEYERLSGQELRAKTDEFRQRLAAGETLDDLLPEAFAAVREAAKRTLKQRHFDVQLIGGMVLHEGKIAEMKTGEGKTLVATLPAYLNALTGRGVHIVTVNDYLAKRDSEWMGPIYRSLGLTVGVILHHLNAAERRAAYGADITYGTNNEFGFDYLRDNMAISPDEIVQREQHYAIVDEVDSILIDEARTPLIISGPVERDDERLFLDLKPLVIRLRQNQSRLIRSLLDEGIRLREEGSGDEALEKFLLVKRGDPKNPRLLELIAQEPSLKGRIDRLESRLSVEKTLPQLDGELFCVVDEHANAVELTEKGLELLGQGRTDDFVLPELDVEAQAIEESDLPIEEKAQAREALDLRYRQISERIHAIHQLVKAYWLFEQDVNYVVKDGQVLIVDEFTGRLMPGRRWSDGLHEAIEAKEGVKVAEQNQTLATITFQNYFRMYAKLAGMTGTAETEAAEFSKIYKLDVVVIPTNVPMIRVDHPDVIYRTQRYKFQAVVEEIKEKYQLGQPVLVGTITIENSERLSRLLRAEGIPHQVLNAKYHEKEAEIIAQAGRLKAVTIATNMAGRGTDIMLGGNPDFLARAALRSEGLDPVEKSAEWEAAWPAARARAEAVTAEEHRQVVALGGLHIIGTERHESRRIDNQLRGRSGRQGDPGSSRFYVSLEDDLMRLFGGEMIGNLMQRLGWTEDMPIDHPRVSKSIEGAQRKVEARNFDLRKNVLEYDDVLNKQREIVYAQRRQLLAGEDVRGRVVEMIEGCIDRLLEAHAPERAPRDEWDLSGLLQEGRLLCLPSFGLSVDSLDGLGRDALRQELLDRTLAAYADRERQIGAEQLRELERIVLLRTIDSKWMDHLQNMDDLREGIGLRAYGQHDPLVAYKFEAYKMFKEMTDETQADVVRYLTHLRLLKEETQRRPRHRQIVTNRDEDGQAVVAQRRVVKKVGRNDPCPCGSGRKYKKCCGANTA